jgi:putative endonuclease
MREARGRAAEDAALAHLRNRGLSLLARNYRCRLGEIDLVMREGDELVFVEVRARGSEDHGGAAGSVDACKQRRLRLAARHFLMTHPRAAAWPARFDVVAISGPDGENEPHWIRAAFDGAS